MNRNSEYFTFLADYENIGFQYVTEDFTNVRKLSNAKSV